MFSGGREGALGTNGLQKFQTPDLDFLLMH